MRTTLFDIESTHPARKRIKMLEPTPEFVVLTRVSVNGIRTLLYLVEALPVRKPLKESPKLAQCL
jgi:hypothetical protein